MHWITFFYFVFAAVNLLLAMAYAYRSHRHDEMKNVAQSTNYMAKACYHMTFVVLFSLLIRV